MPAPMEATRRSGLVDAFSRGRYCVPPPDPGPAGKQRKPTKRNRATRIWALDRNKVFPPLSRKFRRQVKLKGWKAALGYASQNRTGKGRDPAARGGAAAGQKAAAPSARRKAGVATNPKKKVRCS